MVLLGTQHTNCTRRIVLQGWVLHQVLHSSLSPLRISTNLSEMIFIRDDIVVHAAESKEQGTDNPGSVFACRTVDDQWL